MAALKLNQDPGGSIVLRPPLLRQLGILLSSLVPLGILEAYAFDLFGKGTFNPLPALVIFIAFVFGFGGSLLDALVPHQVIVDRTSRTVTSCRRFLGIPLRTTTASFGDIANVEYQYYYYQYLYSRSYRDAWRVAVNTRDNRHILINWDGKRDEMRALAQQVAELTGGPLVDHSTKSYATEKVVVNLNGRMVPPGEAEKELRAIIDSRELPQAERDEAQQMLNFLTGEGEVPREGRNKLVVKLNRRVVPPGEAEKELRAIIDSRELPQAERDKAQQMLDALSGDGKLPKGKWDLRYLEIHKGGLPQPPAQENALHDTASSVPDTEPPPPVASPWSRPKSPPPAASISTEPPATAGEEKASSEATGSDVTKMTIAELEQRIGNDTMDGQARHMLARKYQLIGQTARAVPLYQEALNIDPTNADAQNDLGVALEQQRKLKDAEEAYRRAIALDPFSSTAHLNLGLLLRGMNRASEASQEFSEARQNARTDSETRVSESASTGAKLQPQLSNIFQ